MRSNPLLASRIGKRSYLFVSYYGPSRRTDPVRRRPQELYAAQAQGAGPQARRARAAVRRLPPGPAHPAPAGPHRDRQEPHRPPRPAARHGHRHLSPHRHRVSASSGRTPSKASRPRGPHRRRRRPRRRHRRRRARPSHAQAQSARRAPRRQDRLASWSGPPAISSAPTSSATARASSASTAPSSATASTSATPGPRAPGRTTRSSSRCSASRRRTTAAKASSPRSSGRAASPASTRCPSSAPSAARRVPRGRSGRSPRGGRRLPRRRPRRPRGLHRRLIVTIDPADARDFDDAVSLTRRPEDRHWQLAVHIADVGHFAPPGGALDREARKRGTSVYLPQRVIPMFPEIISNSLASLQQGRVRYVKSVLDRFHADGPEDRRPLRQRRPSGSASASPTSR